VHYSSINISSATTLPAWINFIFNHGPKTLVIGGELIVAVARCNNTTNAIFLVPKRYLLCLGRSSGRASGDSSTPGPYRELRQENGNCIDALFAIA
jgi:hypothetical protein